MELFLGVEMLLVKLEGVQVRISDTRFPLSDLSLVDPCVRRPCRFGNCIHTTSR